MAKKKKDEGGTEEKKNSGLILTIIVVVLIVLMCFAIFAFLVKLNVGGLGTALRPALKNVPVVNRILPELSENMKKWEDEYPFITDLSSANDYIEMLDAEIKVIEDYINDYPSTISRLNADIDRLREYEENVLEFEEMVKRFDYQVVFNSRAPSLFHYEDYYHELYPENADEIHSVIADTMVYDEGINEQAVYFKTMKPAKAAEILEEMTADIGWIVKVLRSMKETEAAAIINKMDPLYAAKIFRRMEDMSNESLENFMNEIAKYLGE